MLKPKYFDFNELKQLSEAQLKWERQHGQVQLGSARAINKRGSYQEEELKERKEAEEMKRTGSFRRTSAPPKVPTGKLWSDKTDPLIQRV